jgi:hypothetical protein
VSCCNSVDTSILGSQSPVGSKVFTVSRLSMSQAGQPTSRQLSNHSAAGTSLGPLQFTRSHSLLSARDGRPSVTIHHLPPSRLDQLPYDYARRAPA